MRRSLALAAISVGILLSPVTVWWLVGDLSETTVDPDYMVRPLDLTSTQELVLGIVATAGTVAAVTVTGVAVGRRVLTLSEVGIALPLLLAGAVCGFAWRVVTAGVIGANIGGGMILMLAPGFVAIMLGLSVLQWRIVQDKRSK